MRLFRTFDVVGDTIGDIACKEGFGKTALPWELSLCRRFGEVVDSPRFREVGVRKLPVGEKGNDRIFSCYGTR
jgi:hypothetical protein